MRVTSKALAATLGLVSAGAFGASLLIEITRGSIANDDIMFFYVAYGALLVLFGSVGMVVARRVPKNPIGWIFLGLSLWISLGGWISVISTALGDTSGADLTEWFGHWAWIPIILIPATFVLLLFPDGRLPSRRWRWLAWSTGAGVAGFIAATMFGEFLGGLEEYGPNPFHHETISLISTAVSALVVPALIGSLASVAVRFRRSPSGVERQQIKWLLYSGIVGLVAFISAALLSEIISATQLADLIVLTAVAFVPVSIGLAILRFRLYDIDRLISRTVSYALIVMLLGAVYALGAVWLPTRFVERSPLFVAGSTLTVAALFSPIRHRVMSAVDRRFYRSRYQLEQIIDEYVAELRDQVDLDRITSGWVSLVTETLQPVGAGIWLKTYRGS